MKNTMRDAPVYEYGLRRYEASQRILWSVFTLVCFGIAYPASGIYQIVHQSFSSPSSSSLQSETSFKTVAFWTRQSWIHEDPLGGIITYLAFVALIFWTGRFLWLVIQYGSKYFAQNWLTKAVKRIAPHSESDPFSETDPASKLDERLFPMELLQKKVHLFHFTFLFHPYLRLRLMLNNHSRPLSSEELLDRERRASETDWQLLWSSWLPFRWLLWLLPFLALLQTSWIFYTHLEPVLAGQKDVQDALSLFLMSLLPMVQVIPLAFLFNVGYGILRQFEVLYLSNIDALFYDQLVSRLPFQSSDTFVLLKMMKQNFEEVQHVLQRIERSLGSRESPSPRENRIVEKVK